MKLTIEHDEPLPPEVAAALAHLLDRLGAGARVTTDADWTVERLLILMRDVNPRTLLLLDAAIEGQGWVDGPAFRAQWGENSMRGPSQTITRAIKRGAEQGHWPPDITPPIRPTTPDKTGWSKTGGYYLADGLLPLLTEAMRQLKAAHAAKAAGHARDRAADGNIAAQPSAPANPQEPRP
ncbi:hypothetical protein ACFWBI_36765 [Streptomyces sp. NPDC059982]|uniref:hypothetical protein n=1 Tax=unclassified Streptomyces TaxID=2593676 RepID=UPI0036776F3A